MVFIKYFYVLWLLDIYDSFQITFYTKVLDPSLNEGEYIQN